MGRSAKVVGQDVVRTLRRCLNAEVELQAAHGAGDFERAWQAAVKLKVGIDRSMRVVEEFCKLVKP